MNLRKVLIAATTAASAGYVAWRAFQLTRPAPPVRADAKAYGRTRRALAVTGAVRSTAAGLAFAYGPIAPRIARVVEPLPVWLRPAAFSAIASLASSAVELPVSIAEEHEIERRYGLTEQPRADYLADLAKSTALELALTAFLATLGAAALRRFPKSWPVAAAAGAFPLYVLANLIVPVYVMPLFNKFQPLEGPLEAQLRALARDHGVGDAEILSMDMSRQTKKANAFVTGIGKTHRIVLGDTLIEHFTPDEIEFVIAHELGHYVSGDTWRLIGVAEALTVVILGFAAYATKDDRSDDALKLARVAALLSTAATLLRPALAAFSRSREWAADRFALAATNDAASGAAAFRRLRDQNLAEDDVPDWYEFFFGSHPSLGKRIAALSSSATNGAAAATNS
jgi:STE24 endopeptidase